MTSLLVETDLIVEFLIAPKGATPLLRRLLEGAACYCTFVQAAEIYAAAAGEEERRIVERALFGLKILGASSRYAKTIGALLSSSRTMRDHRTAIVAAMALESKMPIVSDRFAESYAGIPGLRLIRASSLRATGDAVELESALAVAL